MKGLYGQKGVNLQFDFTLKIVGFRKWICILNYPIDTDVEKGMNEGFWKWVWILNYPIDIDVEMGMRGRRDAI